MKKSVGQCYGHGCSEMMSPSVVWKRWINTTTRPLLYIKTVSKMNTR